ncbi:MAG TPA: rhamnulokinase family protein [Gemmataceae bacterium]|nr:rhamnulokinase family protein [Gemmataceae bacterium]
MTKLLAFDLGAESGRAVLGHFDGSRLRLEVLTRFANEPVRTLDALHWDVLRLHHDMIVSLRKCAAEHGGADSVGVDTWGVDFALVGRGGVLLGNPRHYRDPHTEGVMEAAFARMPRPELFRRTGIQFMRFNSLFQLLALQRDRSPLLDAADTLLFMPDLFHYFLTGEKVNEYTDASTSQMLDPAARSWSPGLLRSFDLPERLQGKIVQPGTVLGPLHRPVVDETGLKGARVVAPATHDTAAAVAAVPAQGDAWAYISSGTWSLMGVETPAPRVGQETLAANFTNEGGVNGTIRILKNIMGLWLVQECRRAWEREGKAYSYDDLTRLAEAAPAFAAVVNPNDDSFIYPANMPAALADYCRRTGQPAPNSPGGMVRCALEGLALCYRWVLERLEGLTGKRLQTIHIVGGGSQNALLNQFTADACDRPVLAGPVEATAIGNVLTQAIGLGVLGSLADAREIVRRSFEVASCEPKNPDAWKGPYARFQALRG